MMMMMMMKGGLAWGYPFPCCPEEEHLQRSIEIDTNPFGLFLSRAFVRNISDIATIHL